MFFGSRTLIACAITLLASIAGTAQVEQKSSDAQLQSSSAPIILSFQDALARAKKNLPEFLSARTDLGLAHQDKVQARAALLPSVNFNTQFLYTQPNGVPSGVFIANNSVHEYVSQGNAHEAINLGGGQFQDLRRTRALEAAAHAKLEVASRGLAVTVAQTFYGLVTAQRKYATAQTAFTEAEKFLKIS